MVSQMETNLLFQRDVVISRNRTEDPIQGNLIARAKRGSPDATSILYRRYYQSIYRYFYYRTGDPQTAEDLTAEVFLKMVEAIPNYRIEATPFKAWLFQIARNLAIDHFRRSSAHPVTPIHENMDTPDADVEGALDFHLSSRGLAEAFMQIEDGQRDVLLMRFIEEMPIAEAARALHKTEDAVKALQRRGLNALRQLLNLQEESHD
jgi:RNA polymerase sigma-70 factor (ECF subfamily)